MTLNDKQLPLQPGSGSEGQRGSVPAPGANANVGGAVRAVPQTATAAPTSSGGDGVLQHLEDQLEDEPEPPEKGLRQSSRQVVEPVSREFTILSKIGEGGYGNVYTVKKVGQYEQDSGKIYALKVRLNVLL